MLRPNICLCLFCFAGQLLFKCVLLCSFAMTDEIIIVNSSNLHESNITNTNMTSFVSPSLSPSSSLLSLSSPLPQHPRSTPQSTEQQPPPINKNNSKLPLHERHAVDVDENIIKTQNIISNKDDVEAAISNSNKSQKLLIDTSHQLLLPSQQHHLQQQQLTRSNLVNLNAYQSVSSNCIKRDCAQLANTDKLAENQLFAYEKCLSATSIRYSKKVDRTGCKKLINLWKISKSDSCLHKKDSGERTRTLTASHDCWNNFTNDDHGSGEFCCLSLYLLCRRRSSIVTNIDTKVKSL